MKLFVRAMSVLLILSLAVFLTFGCTKKSTKPADDGSKVSQTVMKTTPSTANQTTTGSARVSPPVEETTSQLLALRNEDIPISEPPPLEFIDPSPEDSKILQNIYFDFDKSNIRMESQSVLENISEWLNQNSLKQLLIEGHCDERGTNEYNLALGERRSLGVRRYLVGLGISPDRLHTISYGEEKPADPGHNEDSWAENRRAEFKVSTN